MGQTFSPELGHGIGLNATGATGALARRLQAPLRAPLRAPWVERLIGIVIFGLVPTAAWMALLIAGTWAVGDSLAPTELAAIAIAIFLITSFLACVFESHDDGGDCEAN